MERFFLGSNTPQGYVGFYNERFEEAQKIWILKGGPGTGKSTLMKKIASEAIERGEDYELWMCSGDPKSLDGIFLKERKTMVVDGTNPHPAEPVVPVLKENIVNLLECVDDKKLEKYKNEILQNCNEKKVYYHSAYHQLLASQELLKSKREEFEKKVSKEKLLQLAKSLANHIQNYESKKIQFSRALTADGFVEYKDQFKERVIVGLKCEDVEIAHAFFDILKSQLSGYSAFQDTMQPNCTLALTVGKFGIVVCDGCFVPNEIIDLNSSLKEEIRYDFFEEKKLSDRLVALAIKNLFEARESHFKTEKFFVEAMNFEMLNEKSEKLLMQIFDF